MRQKRCRIWFLALLLSLAAAGCVSREEVQNAGKVEGLNRLGKIEVISREEGSGTRSTYPLNRAFYLAYSGKLNDLEQDFLTFVKGKG